MKKFFSLVLALVMALSLTTAAWGADEVAEYNGTKYATLADAVDAVPDGGTATITLLKSTTGAGIKLDSSAALDITFDFDGYTYTCTDPAVGSSGTETQGFHFGTGNTVKMMDGTINVKEGSAVKMLIQNYCDLTLENMTVDGTNLAPAFYGDPPVAGPRYTVSVNSGAVVIDDTTVIADDGEFAFDTYDSPSYGGTPSVTVTGASVIDGDVEASGGNLVVEDGYFAGEIVAADAADAALIDVNGGTFAVALPTGATLPTGTTLVPDAYGNLVIANTADVPTSSAKVPYFTTDFVSFTVSTYCDIANYNYSLKPLYNGSETAKMFDVKAIYAVDKTYPAGTSGTPIYNVVVAASPDSATLAFVNGREITYLNTVETTWEDKVTAVKTVDFEDVEKCGDVFTANDVAVYEDAAGDLYVENSNGVAYNVGGELVKLIPAADGVIRVDLFDANAAYASNVVYTIGHDYDYDVKSVGGKQSVTRVFCADKDCKKDFKFLAGTEAEAIQKFQAGNYVDTGLTINGTTVVWAAKNGVPAGGSVTSPSVDTSTDKVQSADTFDAGIAMYVGMSVMAAAGSAVVIGKKKD